MKKKIVLIRRIVAYSCLSLFLSFIISSLIEIIGIMIVLGRTNIHDFDATPLQPYLYTLFVILFFVFDILLIKKFVLKRG
ncbi:hypothetical protein A2159_02280 [Candidatus Woesebacteria bacterium RBG_13_34_9]|uniref:Uncharacterized protein n=1 Tax=Candidatus Woesebacteria bacterium RBG_13_34_9 TaxID=1802477 RepID=A0A1F7X1Q6_9BACT|nr:MAG: hypothetical protein A2159_02280 [Candidatus Woesebacteria bacterium RBG_13_34_9]